MNKKLFIITGISGTVILILLIVAVVSISRRAQPPSSSTVTQTATTVTPVKNTPLETPAEEQLQLPTPIVLSSNPRNGQENVPVSTKQLTISLSEANLSNSEMATITFQPPTLFSYKALNNDIQITFLKPLLPGETYSYSLSTKGSPDYYGYFKTAGPSPTAAQAVEPPGYYEELRDQQIQEFPDIYLSNYVPFETAVFSITAAKNNDGIYIFTVTRKGNASPVAVKQQAEQWIISQGLAREQISQLQITYK